MTDDRIARHRALVAVFVAGFAVFTAASLCCGLALTAVALAVVARAPAPARSSAPVGG
jgi:hypothetical protein